MTEKDPMNMLKDLMQGKEPEEIDEEEIEIDEEQMKLLLDNIALMADGDIFGMQAIILSANAAICEQIREAFYREGGEGPIQENGGEA